MSYLILEDFVALLLGLVLSYLLDIMKVIKKQGKENFKWKLYLDLLFVMRVAIGLVAAIGLLLGTPEALYNLDLGNWWSPVVAFLIGLLNILLVEKLVKIAMKKLDSNEKKTTT